jgi:hypothetical protein
LVEYEEYINFRMLIVYTPNTATGHFRIAHIG